ncbi:MAG: YfbU family protein [Ignavibacteriae bacterium]|nr:YfbU family protein [Ignavibacteriota bacterium]
MKLTLTERLILANQYLILEALYPQEADYYIKAREAIEYGYELEYDNLSENLNKGNNVMTKEECLEVIDILTMFDTLKISFERLSDKSGIEQSQIEFLGFDGNNEIKQMAYAQYFCTGTIPRFTNLNRGDNFNSHMPTLSRYRAMLIEWKKLPRDRNLTKDEILKITSVYN